MSRLNRSLMTFICPFLAVTGAKISEYLLEKSRVVAQGPQERNFHVFYYMLVGLSSDRKRELKLSDSKPFKYVHT